MDYSIFRAYDIRGVFGETITEKVMENVGNLICQYAEKKDFVVARDARLSSPALSEALIKGIRGAGGNVLDVGLNPLGSVCFQGWRKGKITLYITASHLPKEWNGLKMFYPNGEGFREEEIVQLKEMYEQGAFAKCKEGRLERMDNYKAIHEYIDYLTGKITPERKIKVVLDCGNGASSVMAKALFEKAGFQTKVLFGEPDGRFPNRGPDQMKDPLDALRKEVSHADFGIAYDGDGDRMTPVDEKGRKLGPEQTSYVILAEVLKKEKGPVLANVECSRIIDDVAGKFGRKVVRIKVGHTFLVEEAHKQNGSFGVEVSGHFVMPSLIPYDDSLAISYYMACILSRSKKKLSELVDEIKSYPFEREGFDCPDGKKFAVVEKLQKRLAKEFKDVNTLDGVRVDFLDGWVLIRASNTSSKIRMTVEADTQEGLDKLRNQFGSILKEEIG